MWSLPARVCTRELLSIGLDDFEVMTIPGHFWLDEASADQNLASPISEMHWYTVDLYKLLIQLAAATTTSLNGGHLFVQSFPRAR